MRLPLIFLIDHEMEGRMVTEYLRFSSLQELLERRRSLDKNCVLIAGGTELNRLDSPLADADCTFLSLDGLGLDTITVKDDGVLVGAMVSFQQIIDSSVTPQYLKDAALGAGSRPLRNMATIGGNIASFRDDSYLLPVCFAAKARIITAELDEQGRLIEEDLPIREYIENFASFKGSCITGIFFNKQNRCVKVKRFSRTAQRRPDAIIAFGNEYTNGQLYDVRIAVGAMGLGITRLKSIEDGINDGRLRNDSEIQHAVSEAITPKTDITGSSEYKRYLVGVTISDMLKRCLVEAKGGSC